MSRDARKMMGRMRGGIVMSRSRVVVKVLVLTGVRWCDFRDSMETVGIIRVHRVSVRRGRDWGHTVRLR